MMGCFFACFGTCKHRHCRKLANIIPEAEQGHVQGNEAPQATSSSNQENIEKPINPIQESKEKLEERSKCSSRKKVTFDLNVETYEEICPLHVLKNSQETNAEEEARKGKETSREPQCLLKNTPSYPPNYRYQNCSNSDDEYEGLNSEGSDFYDDDDDDEQKLVQEETSGSLFSISIESRAQVFPTEMDDVEVNSPMPNRGSQEREKKTIMLNQIARNRSQHVHSALNPVENLSQWNEFKAGVTPLCKNQAKDNMNLEQGFDTSICHSKLNPKHLGREVAVDASLSSWLVKPGTTPNAKTSTAWAGNSPPAERSANSSIVQGDRPILGALTVEELKQVSRASSPRKSPRRHPDDMPIIGTVGSYWSHTGQALDSDSGSSCKGLSNASPRCTEDTKVKWNSTPFEIRLDRALDRGVAEA
ncbi:uncharacterized protein LOC131153542 [Malania oleifera]|uniref:uncharacterized protein LOC131153542 n=1 Tax=Malania oleifera TaxID=397392 RepID=UPI0025ADA107|nr:uncharacterized protein LOC131153542 [Malania oleifera]